MSIVLEVEGIGYSYGSRSVFSDISFSVEAGESVAIMGANGAGKSTLLWCLLGLLRPTGKVRLFGETPAKMSRLRLGVVFQNPEDQLFMPALLDDAMLCLRNRGVPAKEAQERAQAALDSVGLGRQARSPASHLSLGQRKRAAIAVTLLTHPELLLLDEPTAELDGRSVRELKELIRRLPAAKVITSHHLEFLRDVCTRALVLCDGRIAAEGPVREILADTNLLERAGLLG